MNTNTGRVRNPGYRFRVGARVCLLIGACAYLAFMLASHSRPFASGLEAPLAAGGWLILAAQIIHAALLGRRHGGGRPVVRFWATLRTHRALAAFAALVAILLGAAAASESSGNRSLTCENTAQTRIKLDNWSDAGGVYLRQYPYTAQGARDSNAA